jgi:RNA polymerase sigma-70 factor (ECF subfamily)
MATRQFTDEQALLRRVVAGDQGALSALYDRYARVMFAIALKVVGSTEEAEEVVLDAFSQVWRTAARYDASRGRLDAWLFLITRSRALDRLRAMQRQEKALEASEEAVSIAPLAGTGPEEDALIAERREAVVRALGELPEPQRRLLELVYYEGLSHSEAAERTGEPLGTVKTRIRSGLGKLRDALAAAWGR